MAESKQGQRTGTGGGTSSGGAMEPSAPSGVPVTRTSGPAGRSLSPFAWMRRMGEEMERAWEEAGLGFGRGLGMPLLRGIFHPQIEVLERDNKLVVRADLPGLRREDIRVEVLEDALWVEGERKLEREVEEQGIYRSERSYGHFRRLIPLPRGILPEHAQAVFKNGVLEVSFELPQGAGRGGRRIDIREEGEGASGPPRRPSA